MDFQIWCLRHSHVSGGLVAGDDRAWKMSGYIELIPKHHRLSNQTSPSPPPLPLCPSAPLPLFTKTCDFHSVLRRCSHNHSILSYIQLPASPHQDKMKFFTVIPLLATAVYACEDCYGSQLDGAHARNVRRMQPDAQGAVARPKGPLQWGQLNFLHTTDTHGWLEGSAVRDGNKPRRC